MFLNLLNDKQKELFLELANHALLIDGHVKEEELGVFESFKLETGLFDYTLKKTPTKDILMHLSGASKKAQKAIIIEILGILVSDIDIDEGEDINRDEQAFVEQMATQWNINKRSLKQMQRWVEDFDELLDDGWDLINNKK